MFRSNNDFVEHNVYKKYDNRTFNNTNNITKHINNHSNDVINNYKINGINNVKKTCYNFNGGITLNKTGNKHSNGTYNINNTFNTTDNQYFTKTINNTSNITNDTTRPSHNNYEHNVIKRISKHIKHINNYGTGISYYSKKSVDKGNYCNFDNGSFQFQKD